MLNKEELKKLFENGDIPRQEDFWEWQASYFHKEDSIPPENIAYDFTRKADLVDGKVPASQLPSYVDDVLEFGSYAELPQSGEKGKIYITTGDNKQYRWGGSSYVGIDNTQLGNYIPYEGADRTVSLNSQNLQDVKHFYSHSGIQDGTMGLSVINDAVGGFKSNLLIRVSAMAGNMLTFTVKLYSYPYEFYEFQINLYRYQENHYEPTVNWKSGESTHIGKIEFYKDPASGDFYVLILGSQLGIFAYPRVAITDLQAYLGDQTFNKDHWKLEWDADASSLVLQATTLSEYFKKDSRAVTTHTDQAISGSKTFKRDLNLTDDGLGINFEGGNKIYKKIGSGITLKKGSSNQNPRVESNDGTKSWEIIHEGNLQNIVSGNNGWGGNVNNILDPNITHKSGFYGADANSNLPENNYTTWINVNAWAEHDNYGFQLASPLFGDNMYFRKYRSTGYDQKNHTDWYKLWTSNNFNPNDYWGKRDMGIYRAVTTNKPLGILNENNQAQRLLAGGLLLSDGYADESLVPHLGIYSKGDINTPGTVISDKFSSSKLNGSQIINAGNAHQLYIGNSTVDSVYHESGNNHIFTSKGNAGFTIDSNGNATAKNAVNAGNDSEIGGRIFGKRTMIDTLGLDESKYYPVTIQCNSSYPSTIKVYRRLDSSMGVPSYSTHGGGFWCYYEFEVYGNGWGTTQFKAICNYQDESWVKDDTKVIGYDQMIYSSNVVIYIKGGSKYWFDVNSTSVPTLHVSSYTVHGQTIEPTEARIWSGGILMNANTNDIRNAVNDLGSTLKDYVTLATPQRIDGKKTFSTSYDSYTSDGLFDSGAKPLSTVTPSGKSLLLGYRDFGGGQYYPRLGFTSDQNWSLGPIGNDFTVGMYNNGSHILKLNSDSSSELSNIKFLPFHGGTWIDMPSSGISGIGSGGPGINAWLAMPKAAGEFFSNAEPGDLISRNQGKKIMWGNDATDAGMYLANNILYLKNNINIQGNDAWHTGNLEDYHQYGLGTFTQEYQINIDEPKKSGFYSQHQGLTTGSQPFSYATILHQSYMGTNEFTQIAIQKGASGFAFRNESSGWNYAWHSGNFSPEHYLSLTGGALSGDLTVNATIYTNNHGDSSQWQHAYAAALMNRGLRFTSNTDADQLPIRTEIASIELPNGSGNINFPFNNYGTFMRMESNAFTSDFAHEHNGNLWFKNFYNPNKANGATWRKVWDSINFNPDWYMPVDKGIYIDTQVGINNGSAGRSNKVWFDYNWAGTGGSGSVINFSGLNGNYSTELFSEYNGNHVGIRTHNGDNNTWSLHKWLWHSNNFNPDSKANVSQLFKNLIYTSNLNKVVDSGIYRQEDASSEFFYTTTLNLNSSDGRQQLSIDRNGSGMKFRGTPFGSGDQGWSNWLTALTIETDQHITGLKTLDRAQGNYGNGWNLTKNKDTYALLVETGQGSSPTDNYGTAIGFYNEASGGSQASIIVRNNGANGTSMGFTTTDSYAAGPQLALSISNIGKVNFERQLPSFQNKDLATQAWTADNCITTDTSSQTKAGNLALAAGATFKVSGVDNNHIQSYNESTGNAGVVSAWVHSHYATRWKAGNKRGGSTESLGYAFHFSDDNGATYNEKVLIQPDSNIVTANFGTASAWYQAYNWGNHANAGYATQNYVSQNYIPKSHPVNNINAANIDTWNNAISQSSASEEIILEDGQLAVQPDEFSLKGSSSYDIASRRKLIHVLFREGNELNIGKIRRRQTFIIFNFEKSSVSINIEGLKPYLLAPATKITLYIDDEGEVLMYDESNFKKLG